MGFQSEAWKVILLEQLVESVHTWIVHLHIHVQGVPGVVFNGEVPGPVLATLGAVVAGVVHVAHQVALTAPHHAGVPSWVSGAS